jgi:hypothetical protein
MKTLMLIALMLLPFTAHANEIIVALDGGSTSDSDLVHGLAHFSAGTMIGYGTDELLTLTNVKRTDWVTRTVVCGAMAWILTNGYELATDKSPTVQAQHNLVGFLGGIAVPLGIQLELTSW